MRPPAIALVFLLALGSVVSAQAVGSRDTLLALRTPISPVFALMGISPVSIERPTTPRAFALDLLSKSQNLSALPESYGVEVAPFWLVPHPLLEYSEFYQPSILESIAQTLTLSLGTAPSLLDTLRTGTNVGVGFRMLPVRGRESSLVLAARNELTALQDSTLGLFTELTPTSTRADSVRIDSLMSEVENDVRRLALGIADRQEPVGMLFEVAGALNWRFPVDDFDRGRLAGAGLWSTFGYRLEAPKFDLLGLARFLHYAEPGQDVIDLGGRVIWQVDRLSLSGEAIHRISLGDTPDFTVPSVGSDVFDTSNRLDLSVEYRISDGFHLYATYGKDHRDAVTNRHKLIALAGLKLEFGHRPILFGQ